MLMRGELQMLSRQAMLAALVLLGLVGCSGGEVNDVEEGAPTDTVAQTRTVTVEIVDNVPLDVYFKANAGGCTSLVWHDPNAPAPEVTIKDGAGTILAAKDGPDGGTFTENVGCRVPVVFSEVPAADVYTVSVTGPHGDTADRTVQASDGDMVIEVTF